MPRHLAERLRVVLVLFGGLCLACSSFAQGDKSEAVSQYEFIVLDVLQARLQSDIWLDGDQVKLQTSPSRLLKSMKDVVRASVPYYFDGALGEFKKFSPRVRDAVTELDGFPIPPPPSGWTSEEWRYYQVEKALSNAVLLVSLDIGVFANQALAEGAMVRSDLARDWDDLRGGRDPIAIDPLPEFGEGSSDESSLEGLGGADGTGQEVGLPRDRALDELTAAVRALADRVDGLERRGGSSPSSTGGFAQAGLDGGWVPSSNVARPSGAEGLPEQFTLQFPEGSAALGLSAEYGLNALMEWMFAYPNLRVMITGHSDATGSARSNMELSRRRAQVVRYYLLELGAGVDRVTVSHFGEERPEWGGAFDRRVEVRLTFD